jgi:hypothetical protein
VITVKPAPTAPAYRGTPPSSTASPRLAIPAEPLGPYPIIAKYPVWTNFEPIFCASGSIRQVDTFRDHTFEAALGDKRKNFAPSMSNSSLSKIAPPFYEANKRLTTLAQRQRPKIASIKKKEIKNVEDDLGRRFPIEPSYQRGAVGMPLLSRTTASPSIWRYGKVARRPLQQSP